ncbi:MAG TPA: DNA polymerase I [Thermoanaerobaculaceae bacterium]|nr:DNA polymerase I [Thermoanaerobaculaceae bacterium]HRS17304.1 DNA polymerase I [Thermoanaerobaculaceae bacterium]
MPRLLLVDGHSNLYRAFFALRTPLSAPDGTPTGAAYAFLRMQHRLLRELAPTHVAVAFDAGRETFRTRMDERYKAQRPPMPDELRVQVPLVHEALRALGLAVLSQEGVEADDLIGTLASLGAERGFEVVIASADKDLMQLVRDPLVRMWHTRHEKLLDEAGVTETFGVPPAQVAEVLAIMGDSSDNVPGCPGIGEKGAMALVREWGTVAAVLEHLGEVRPPRLAALLAAHRDEVELSRRLVAIRTDLDPGASLDELAMKPPDREGLAALYRRLGFASLLAEVERGSPAAVAAAAAPPVREAAAEAVAAALASSRMPGVAWVGDELAVAHPEEVLVCRGPASHLAGTLAPRLAGGWCHDAKALLARLRDAGAAPPALPTDAMLAGYLLEPGAPVDPGALARRFDIPPPASGTAVDLALTIARLAAPLAAALAREGLERVLTEIEMPLVPVLEDMERRGIRLEPGVLAELSRRLEASLVELERDIHAEAGGPFNVNSPQQLAEVLFARRGLPVLRRTAKTRAPSTDAEVLAELAARGFRLPALILEYREQAKLKSTYADALPRQVAADGRIHTRFNQAVTSTGRLSSSDPNLQNIPVRSELGRAVRAAFVAEEGHVLVAADYSQIELRVLAHLSEEPTLLRAFAAGEDIHATTAALVFGVAPELVGPEQRRAAKTINFGLIYGMGAFSLSKDLGVSPAEAQRFIDSYFARLPRVREFLEATKAQARATGRVATLFGRIRRIEGLDASSPQLRGNAERQAINAPVQGTAADLIKLAMIRLAARLDPARAWMVLQVHDELLVEAPAAGADAVASTVREVMEGAAVLRVPLGVDLGVGRSWGEAKG